MDIKRLEIFLKLLDTRSFSQTAQFFGLSQPTVSQNLKSLEEFLGQKLFERTPRRVKALPAALVLAPYAIKIVETAGQAAWAVNRQMAVAQDKLAVGASSVPSLVLVPPAVELFSQRYPRVFLTLTSGHSREIARLVQEGDLDLGLVGTVVSETEKIWARPYAIDRLVLVASVELAHKMGHKPKTPADLANWPIILREDGSGTRAAFLSSLGDEVSRFRFKAEVAGVGPTMNLVRSSFGAAVVSNMIVSTFDMTGLVAWPLEFGPCRRFFLIRRKDHFNAQVAQALVDIFFELKRDGKMPFAQRRVKSKNEA
ncbi:MAG: LysR family transcriptional regulator [Deltaproteobacteria bacterium]|jgi:DNA-binding transcriptional LysR family regulator|nr:LysR family transcriptional regulator [Deltaproteobacteria bacterium]